MSCCDNFDMQCDNADMQCINFDMQIESIYYVPDNDHNKLFNRDKKDQHPISAITGLQEKITELENMSVELPESLLGFSKGIVTDLYGEEATKNNLSKAIVDTLELSDVIIIPKGEYNFGPENTSIKLRSNTTLVFSPNAIVKFNQTVDVSSAQDMTEVTPVFDLTGCENVKIYGGKFINVSEQGRGIVFKLVDATRCILENIYLENIQLAVLLATKNKSVNYNRLENLNINNISVAIILTSRFSKTNPIYIEYNTINNCQIKNPLVNGSIKQMSIGIQVVGSIIKDNLLTSSIKHAIHHNICSNVNIIDVGIGFSVNCGLYPLVLKNCGLYLSIESDPYLIIYGYEEYKGKREDNIVPLINKIEGCHFDRIQVADPRYFSSDDNKNLNLGSDYNLAVPTYVARRDDNEEEDVTALLSVIENKAEREKDYNPATSTPRYMVTDLLKLVRKDKDPTKDLKSFDLYLDLKRDSYNYALADRFIIEGGEVVLKDATLNVEEGFLRTRGMLFAYTAQTDTGISTTKYYLRVEFDEYANVYRLVLNGDSLAFIDDIPSIDIILTEVFDQLGYIQATKERSGFVMIGDNIEVVTKKVLDGKVERDVSVISVKLGDKNNYGLLKVGKNIEVNNNTISIPEASNSVLGLVKGGGNINILNGILNVSKATSESLGAIKIGSGLNISEDGTVSVNEYELSAASETELGGIKLGYTSANKNYAVQLDKDNKAFVNVPWVDPTPAQQYGPASADVLGLVKIGKNIQIDPNGVISVKTASNTNLGLVKIGTGIKIAEDGTISADEVKVATTSVLGGIKAGDYIIVSNTGDVTLPIMTTAEITDLFNSAWYGIAN
uniref:hypothetical protein n=1 Tax=Methanobrevibacter smithii TaxID=2173 RepID=UPI0037DD2640